MAVQFDGDNLIATLDAPTAGVLQQTAEQIYDEAKQWHLNANNRKYPFPFLTSGGEPITTIEFAGQYYFWRNDLGWRIETTDEDQDVQWSGNLIPSDLNQRIFNSMPGRTIAHIGLQPLTTVVTTGSGVLPADIQAIEDAIFARIVEDGHSFEELVRVIVADAAGKVVQQLSGDYTIRDLADSKNRIVGSEGLNSGREISSVDGT